MKNRIKKIFFWTGLGMTIAVGMAIAYIKIKFQRRKK